MVACRQITPAGYRGGSRMDLFAKTEYNSARIRRRCDVVVTPQDPFLSDGRAAIQ